MTNQPIGRFRTLTALPLLSVLTALQILAPLSKTSLSAGASNVPQQEVPLQSPLQQFLSSNFAQGFMPPGDGAPEETTTAGSRREMWCDGDRTPIRSLMPSQNYGLTLASQPTIFLEMPETIATQALLVVQNEAGDYNEEAILPIPNADQHGIVSFQIPNEAASLEIGQNYRWSLAIMCQGYLDPSDPFFSGWVQRGEQTTDITQTLLPLSAAEQIEWLGQHGYWYDMVSLILQN